MRTFLLVLGTCASCHIVAGFHDIEPNAMQGGGATAGDGGDGTGMGGVGVGGVGGTGGGVGGMGDLDYAFVTQTDNDGDWRAHAPPSGTGIQGADAVCAMEASAAGLPGVYVAFLSPDDDTPPHTRLSVDGGPWFDVRGELVIADWVALATGALSARLERDAMDNKVMGAFAWTGIVGTPVHYACRVEPGGTFQTNSTANFGMAGVVGAAITTTDWVDGAQRFCNTSARLYCLRDRSQER